MEDLKHSHSLGSVLVFFPLDNLGRHNAQHAYLRTSRIKKIVYDCMRFPMNLSPFPKGSKSPLSSPFPSHQCRATPPSPKMHPLHSTTPIERPHTGCGSSSGLQPAWCKAGSCNWRPRPNPRSHRRNRSLCGTGRLAEERLWIPQ